MNGEGTPVSDFVAGLLARRGIIDADEIARFLHPDFARDTHDPFLMKDMGRAVARILAAIANNERIAVYGDFDCDGIPGASVLFDTFAKIGYEKTEVYIPHRDREGYGFHIPAVDELAKRSVGLIITVDVGGAAIDTVKYAKGLGIDTIVTDHHEITGPLPDAAAIINPKLGEYPFRDLCGAATAWKLASALLIEGKRRGIPSFTAIPDGWEKWLLDLVAIATVADLVPLIGENRALAHFGLTVLRKSPRLGIRALCNSTRLRQANLTEDDIAFSFAPRINAASRMDEPELALRLLTTHDADEAEQLAAKLESLNRKRRGVVAAIVREARSRIKARFKEGDRAVVMGDTQWKPSLMGLAANSIMEERGGIVCLWGRDANGRLKGSCRSDGTVSLVELFTHARASLEEFGGHHASGGFSVSHEAVHTLPEALARAAEHLSSDAVPKEVAEPDGELMLSEVSIPLFRDLSRLAPFGMGNPKPVFRVRKARITFARQFGKEMNHTEVTLVCSESGVTCRAFQFFRTPMDFTLAPSPGTFADVLATVERDAFRGPDRLVLRIADIVLPRV
ncbi:single-stranded-DNA-specific exonuclease RecJ [Candidatus Kaiserbacteria bacterium RIFCSPHIGHO2_01_FULL_56_24]|uniref:Single-stranded-DNA-specific exonuclease RecJ n=1 Tax=Candidatus Kaiserbacteria bacterium RIFCSPHIGHO2_01_FULL_56_24 TaxID=1798487 RepID=A0A1F6DAR3_9BACT|nr:MAG: single-stranded-DNA-specific exonuclease RecJ [Candidatus Kaiserbacteria bacterium RIFCSPHIGHO2_01_FULL_56_24]